MTALAASVAVLKQPDDTECLEIKYRPAALSSNPKRGLAIVQDATIFKKVIADIPVDFEIVIAGVEQIYAPDDMPPLGHNNYLFGHVRGRKEVLLLGDEKRWLDTMRDMLAAANAQEIGLSPKVIFERADDIETKPIAWLWDKYLAKGKLHILAGAPGTGKTTLALALAAIVSRGGEWPDGATARPGDVFIWSGEDDPGDTLIPRLRAMNADLRRIHFISGVDDHKGHRPFDPAHDVAVLAKIIRDIQPAFLIIDSIVSAVAGDSHKNTETRRALQPLVDLAAETGVALFGISHFSKGTSGRDPLERVTGSLAFGAMARVVMAAAKLPEEKGGGRIFCRVKSNIGPDSGGFKYDLEQIQIAAGHWASRIVWQGAVDQTARELLAGIPEPNSCRLKRCALSKAALSPDQGRQDQEKLRIRLFHRPSILL